MLAIEIERRIVYDFQGGSVKNGNPGFRGDIVVILTHLFFFAVFEMEGVMERDEDEYDLDSFFRRASQEVPEYIVRCLRIIEVVQLRVGMEIGLGEKCDLLETILDKPLPTK